MRKLMGLGVGAFFASAYLFAPVASAESVVWGIQVEQAEYRIDEGSDIFAWDLDAFVGKDELKFVLRSEAEFATGEDSFETLENQFRLQSPVTDFFDAVVGVRLDTPEGPDRIHGVIGLHATGGSTNHTMHLVAMAKAAGIQLTWQDISDLSDAQLRTNNFQVYIGWRLFK